MAETSDGNGPDNGPADETRGQRIKRLRMELGMSQLELANKSGARSVDQIRANEDRNTRPGNIAKIAAALNTTVGYLETGATEVAPGDVASIRQDLAELRGRVEEIAQALLPDRKPPRRPRRER